MENVGKTNTIEDLKNATALKSTKETEKILTDSIMLCVELDSIFKLYSYRIISPDQFMARVKDLNLLINKTLK